MIRRVKKEEVKPGPMALLRAMKGEALKEALTFVEEKEKPKEQDDGQRG